MKRSKLPAYSAFAGLLFASAFVSDQASAASASTGPLGYTTIECLWDSDTLCSTAGITLAPEFVGKAAGAPAGNVLTVDAAPGWSADVFANTHYVRFMSGSKVGRYYEVTGNGANTLTLDPAGDDLSTVAAEDGVKLVEYWTLGNLFPQVDQSTIVESLGTFPFQRRTEVLFPDLMGAGVNLAAAARYYLTSTGWKNVVGAADANSVRILPDQYFIVRHPPSSQSDGLGDADGTEFVPLGHVDDSPTTIALSTQPTGSGSQDVALGLSRPVAVSLAESDLISSGAFLGSDGTFPFQRRDELFVFDLDVDTITSDDQGKNRGAVNRYYYNSAAGNWVNATTGTNADNELVFQPGSGVTIRKFNTAGGETQFWVFDPNS